ncbi:MAG TPA: hypothetical protein VEC36_11805 [Patescibacteria group bacterium]|nr:hypothetical protein [Patescibacteria group bacterium]
MTLRPWKIKPDFLKAMRILKIVAGTFFILLGGVFVLIAFRVMISPPKEGTGIDIITISLLLAIMPFVLGAWLLKDLWLKRNNHEIH